MANGSGTAPGTQLDTANGGHAPQVVVAPDHSVDIVYSGIDPSNEQWAILLMHSSDGSSWNNTLTSPNSPIVLADVSAPNPIDSIDNGAVYHANPWPSVAVNPITGDVYAAWTDTDGIDPSTGDPGPAHIWFESWNPTSGKSATTQLTF